VSVLPCGRDMSGDPRRLPSAWILAAGPSPKGPPLGLAIAVAPTRDPGSTIEPRLIEQGPVRWVSSEAHERMHLMGIAPDPLAD
jgi:hypothetical protein